MYKQLLKISFLAILGMLMFTSCSDDTNLAGENNGTNAEQANVSNLINGRLNNDSDSTDLDMCIQILYPIQLQIPGQSLVSVASDDEFETTIDNYFETNPDAEAYPTVIFPITVKKEDGTEVQVNSEEELCDLFHECWGDDDEDEVDDYFRDCFEIQFPITFSLDDGGSFIVNSYEDIESAEMDTLIYNAELQFPITITLQDGSIQTINDEDALDSVLKDCYGDDWNGINDDYDDECEYLDELAGECFDVVYPVTLTLEDGGTLVVNSEDEIQALDTDVLEQVTGLQFPMQVRLTDESIQTLENEEALRALIEDCYEDDDEEGDLEDCFTLVFPVQVIMPDGSTLSADSEAALDNIYEAYFESNEDAEESPEIVFPITVTMEDGSTQVINSEEEIEELIDSCE